MSDEDAAEEALSPAIAMARSSSATERSLARSARAEARLWRRESEQLAESLASVRSELLQEQQLAAGTDISTAASLPTAGEQPFSARTAKFDQWRNTARLATEEREELEAKEARLHSVHNHVRILIHFVFYRMAPNTWAP